MNKLLGIKIRTDNSIDKIVLSGEQAEKYKNGDIVLLKLEGNNLESGRVEYLKDTKKEPMEVYIRKAEQKDLEKIEYLASEEEKAFETCQKLVKKHKLPMRLIGASLSYSGRNLTFYFTAEGRIDFRQLLRELVSTYHKMIRLQQIGPKDAAKIIGGYGLCGREVCCKTFLPEVKSITMDIARDQGMEGVTSSKISGICGKLMCCLDYEVEEYKEMAKKLPKVGEEIKTEKGKGEVISQNILGQKVLVKLSDGSKMEVEI